MSQAEFQENSDYPKQATPRHKLLCKADVFFAKLRPATFWHPWGAPGQEDRICMSIATRFCGLHARYRCGLLWHTNGSCWLVLRQWSQHLKTKVRLRPQKQHCAPICIWYESFLLVPCMFFAWDRVARHNLLLSFLDILIWFLCVCVFSCVFHLISFYVKKMSCRSRISTKLRLSKTGHPKTQVIM